MSEFFDDDAVQKTMEDKYKAIQAVDDAAERDQAKNILISIYSKLYDAKRMLEEAKQAAGSDSTAHHLAQSNLDFVNDLLAVEGMEEIKSTVEQPKSEKSPRQSALRKAGCQAVALTLWKVEPGMTIADMLKRDEILEYGGAKHYNLEKTVRPWLSEIDPRPPEKKSGRPKNE